MKYNAEYDRWISKEGLVYRLNKDGKLTLCSINFRRVDAKGAKRYSFFSHHHRKSESVSRAVWKTFNGEIPEGLQIDHLNTNTSDNRLNNLKLCTPLENTHNPLSMKHQKDAVYPKQGFGLKFVEHFGIRRYEDTKLYKREWAFFKRNGRCRWEGICI